MMAIKDVAVELGLGLHVGEPRAQLRAARARRRRRAGATRASGSASAASTPRKRSTTWPTSWSARSSSCASCRRSTRCTRRASTSKSIQWAAALERTQSETVTKGTSHGIQRQSHRALREPAQRGHARQERPERRHRPRRRARLRRRDAAADQGQRRRASSRTPSSRRSAAARPSRQLVAGDRVDQGQDVDEAETIKNSQIVEELNLPPVKIHCSVLAEDAIKSAIADYRKKQAERRASRRQWRRQVSAEPIEATPQAARSTRASRVHSEGESTAIARQMRSAGRPRPRCASGIRGGGCSGFCYVDRVPRRRRRTRATGARLHRERRDAGARRRRPEEPPLPGRHGARVGADADAPGVQVREPATRRAGCGCGHSFSV